METVKTDIPKTPVSIDNAKTLIASATVTRAKLKQPVDSPPLSPIPSDNEVDIHDRYNRIAFEGAMNLVEAAHRGLVAKSAEKLGSNPGEMARTRRLEEQAYMKLALVSPGDADALVARAREQTVIDEPLRSAIIFDVTKHGVAAQRLAESSELPAQEDDDEGELNESGSYAIAELSGRRATTHLASPASPVPSHLKVYDHNNNYVATVPLQSFWDRDPSLLRSGFASYSWTIPPR